MIKVELNKDIKRIYSDNGLKIKWLRTNQVFSEYVGKEISEQEFVEVKE